MRAFDSILRCFLLATFACAMGGCSGGVSGAVSKLNDTNIKRIANLYTAYQNRNGFVGPKNEAALKAFVAKQMAPDKLAMMGIDSMNIDQHFTSERDGKKFKVKFGVKGGIGVVAAVAFEEVGVDGQRQVAFTNSTKAELADPTRYEQLWNDKIVSAPPKIASAPGRPAD